MAPHRPSPSSWPSRLRGLLSRPEVRTDLAQVVKATLATVVAWVLAAGDVPLALGCIFGLPRTLGRTHRQLLTNQERP